MVRSSVGATVGVAEEEVTIVVCTSGAGPVCLVDLVCFVYLVYPVSLVQPNKQDKPNNGLFPLADCFSMQVSDRCVVGGEYISQPPDRLNSRVIYENGY